MEIWLTFFALVVGGGLVLFLFLRRERPEARRPGHAFDRAPPLERKRSSPTRR